MPTSQRSPPRYSRNLPEPQDMRPQRLSTQTSNTEARTLPSIHQLLPDFETPNQGHRMPQHRTPLSQEPEGPYRPSTSRTRPSPPLSNRPSPIGSGQLYERQRRRDTYDVYPLPMHSGPPSDRGHTTLSATGWPDRPPASSVATSSSYAVPPPSQRGTPYSTPGYGRTPERPSSRHDASHSLPPPPPPSYPTVAKRHSPPPSYPSSAKRHSPSYPPGRDFPNGDVRYESPRFSEARDRNGTCERRFPPLSPLDPPVAYDQRGPPTISASAGYPHPHPPPPPQSQPQPHYVSNGQHYQDFPSIQYDTRDEPARKRRGNLPRWVTDLLKQWFLEHVAHPYPSEQEKNELCAATGLGMTQISNWFINARRRRAPELQKQAHAEKLLREKTDGSNGISNKV